MSVFKRLVLIAAMTGTLNLTMIPFVSADETSPLPDNATIIEQAISEEEAASITIQPEPVATSDPITATVQEEPIVTQSTQDSETSHLVDSSAVLESTIDEPHDINLVAVDEMASPDGQVELTTENTIQKVDKVEVNTAVAQPETIEIVREDGRNREAVAVKVAKDYFSTSNKVIIVNRDKFPDAISGVNISQGQYPILYTNESVVLAETIKQLQAMPLDEVIILGGTNSVNESVVTQITQQVGVKVTRYDGRDRYAVNANVIKSQYHSKNHVVIASGELYSDALYGVSYANTLDAPIVLTKKNQLPDMTVDLLNSLAVGKATIIGGTSTVTTAVEDQLKNLGIVFDRIAGANRYSGSAHVAQSAYSNPKTVLITSGEVFSDALVSAPLAQKLKAPILLVRKNGLDKAVTAYLANHKTTITEAVLFGGAGTVTITNQVDIEKALGIKPYKTTAVTVHSVKAGDTQSSIAKKYNITLNQLQTWNKLVIDDPFIGNRFIVSDPSKVTPVYTRETPSIDQALQWFKNHLGKTSYVSYANRWGKFTYDCSSAIYEALIYGGFLPKQTVLGDTVTLYAQENHLLTPIKRSEIRPGDIFVSGFKDNNRGAYGHTGMVLNSKQIIHSTYLSSAKNGVLVTPIDGYTATGNRPTYWYRLNPNYVQKLKAADIFENSLGLPVMPRM